MQQKTVSVVVTMFALFVVLLIMLGPFPKVKPISREADIIVGNSNGTVTSLGSRAILSCVFTTTPPECSWFFKSMPLKFDGDKYTLVGDMSKGNCSLQINNVNLDDVGSYSCKVTVHGGPTWQSPDVILQILDGPVLFDSNGAELTGEVHVNTQDQLYVTCVTNGTSLSTLQFLVDGIKLQGTVVQNERLHNVSGSSTVPVTRTKSTLQMAANSIKSGARLQCREVQNDAEKEVVIIVHDVKEADIIIIIITGGIAALVVIAAMCYVIIYYFHPIFIYNSMHRKWCNHIRLAMSRKLGKSSKFGGGRTSQVVFSEENPKIP